MGKIFAFIKKEFMEAFPAVVFFFVMFHLVAITQALLLKGYGVTGSGSAVATAFALVVAKVILVVDRSPVTNLFHRRPAIYAIAWKTFIFGLITLVFRFLEETVPLVFRYEGVRYAVRHFFQDVSWTHFWVIQLWLTASLALFCTARELIDVCGAAKVAKRFFGSKGDPLKGS